MHLLSFFILLLTGLVLSVTAANSAEYTIMSKFKSNMQAGHAYALKTGKRLGHQRLIIARITGVPGNLDVSAEMFQIYADPDTNKKYAANKPVWTIRDDGKYRYQAQIDPDLSFTDIQTKGDDLLMGNDQYHRVTSNCITHIKKLLKQIKARQAQEARLHARDIKIIERRS